MTKAVLGTFSDAKAIKGRSVFQIIIELPIEQADKALKLLGGWPQPAESRWVGVALSAPEREKIAEPSPQAAGGHARAQALTPEERSTIAQNAAEARWKPRRPFSELKLSEQAGIRCADEKFQQYLGLDKVGTANWVRAHCGVTSRSELDTNHAAARMWIAINSGYQSKVITDQYADTVR